MPDFAELIEQAALYCGNCQRRVDPRLSWQTASNGVVHLRADCSECDRWIKFCPQLEADGETWSIWAELAGGRPE